MITPYSRPSRDHLTTQHKTLHGTFEGSRTVAYGPVRTLALCECCKPFCGRHEAFFNLSTHVLSDPWGHWELHLSCSSISYGCWHHQPASMVIKAGNNDTEMSPSYFLLDNLDILQKLLAFFRLYSEKTYLCCAYIISHYCAYIISISDSLYIFLFLYHFMILDRHQSLPKDGFGAVTPGCIMEFILRRMLHHWKVVKEASIDGSCVQRTKKTATKHRRKCGWNGASKTIYYHLTNEAYLDDAD